MNARRFLLLGSACLLLTVGRGADWRHDVTLHGVAFSRVKTEPSGLLIGRIASDTVVRDRPCRAGWLHLRADGMPAAFTAACDIPLPRFTIPAGTWVRQHPDGTVAVCAFPRDTLVQGHLCRGTGGPKGVQTAFYPDGALKQFFLARPTRIDGVPCATGQLRGWVELHENGRLKSCRLGSDLVRAGRKLRKGTRINLAPDGSLRS